MLKQLEHKKLGGAASRRSLSHTQKKNEMCYYGFKAQTIRYIHSFMCVYDTVVQDTASQKSLSLSLSLHCSPILAFRVSSNLPSRSALLSPIPFFSLPFLFHHIPLFTPYRVFFLTLLLATSRSLCFLPPPLYILSSRSKIPFSSISTPSTLVSF